MLKYRLFGLSVIIALIMTIFCSDAFTTQINIPPFTNALKSKTTTAKVTIIPGDSLDARGLNAILGTQGKFDAVVTNDIHGGLSLTLIMDDTMVVGYRTADVDTDVVLWFGNKEGGIKYDAQTDSLYSTIDGGTTWSLFGSGIVSDSSWTMHESSIWAPYPGITTQTVGSPDDSTFFHFYDAVVDYVISWVTVYYGEKIADSALVTLRKLRMEISDTASTLVRGVTATNGLAMGGSSGEVLIGINPSWFNIDDINNTLLFIRTNSGQMYFNVVGSSPGNDELTISENLLSLGATTDLQLNSLSASQLLYLDATKYIKGVSMGGSGTMVKGGSIPVFSLIATDPDIYAKIDTTDAKVKYAERADSVAFVWLWGLLDTTTAVLQVEVGDLSSIVAGNGLNGSSLTGPIPTLDVVVGTSTGLGVNADSIYVVTIPVERGGTGATSFTGGGIILGGSPLTSTGVLTNGQLLIGDGTGAPTVGTLTQGTGITVTNGTGTITIASTLGIDITLSEMAANSVNSSNIVDGSIVAADIANSTIDSTKLGAGSVKPSELDSLLNFVMENLRLHGGLRSNWWLPDDAESSQVIGGGDKLSIGPGGYIIGPGINDRTMKMIIPAEWAGSVLLRGYGLDSTKWYDSLYIIGGGDPNGNFIQFYELNDTIQQTDKRRHIQVQIVMPPDADSLLKIELVYKVKDTPGSDSTWMRLKWATIPADSTNLFHIANYTVSDSGNSTVLDTLGSSESAINVVPYQRIWALVSCLLKDGNKEAANAYEIIVTYVRDRL